MRTNFLKILFVFGLISMAGNMSFGQKINWISFEEAVKLNQKEPRKMVIDVYTDWCHWCKVMDQNTFSNEHVAKYINENYYAVKLNAEGKNDITYNGKTYKFVANGSRGYHELAAALLQGQLSFPSVVFLDENVNMLQTVPGYNPPRRFDYIIHYFGDDKYKDTKWEEFSKNYQSPVPEEKKETP